MGQERVKKQGNSAADVKGRFRYQDEEQRFYRTNQFAFTATTLLYLMTAADMFIRLQRGETTTPGYTIAGAVVAIVCALINAVAYIRGAKSRHYRTVMSLTMAVVYLAASFFTHVDFIHFALVGVMALCVPYYDMKYTKRTAVFYGAVYLINVIYRHCIDVMPLSETDNVVEMLTVLCAIITVESACKLGKMFNDDITGSMAWQKDKEREMLDDIIDISKVVKSETDKGYGYVAELYDAAETVQRSMVEISTATEMTAENVQEQNLMTQEIQTAIEETVSRSREMVDVATESNQNIQENIQAIGELKVQAVSIAETNTQVNDSMKKLQQKTREVEEIAGVIFSISSQTNLLALNASIESARAGEAGRGFAVVAEQIRELAEQTKASTESIAKIIKELNQNADEVVHAVDNSMNATEKQNEMILTAADNFTKLDTNITSLIGGINTIDTQISALYEANNKIVESISQLSATTEEITASAEQAKNLSDRNLQSAQETKDALETIQTTSEGMERYF